MCSCLIIQNEYEASWEFGSIDNPVHEPAWFYACVLKAAKPPRARGGGLPSPCPGLTPAAAVQRTSPGRRFLKHMGQNASGQLYFLSFFKKQKYIFIVCGFSSIPPFSLTYNKIQIHVFMVQG